MKGIELKIKRESRGWSQERLAEIAGVTKRTIINWEQSEILSDSKVKLLQSVFSDSIEGNANNKKLSDLTDDEVREIVYKVATNEDRFMQEKIFANIINVRVSKEVSRITLNKEELLKYLKGD